METGLSENAPERSYKFRDGIRTDKGLRRSENQDNYGFAHTSRISLYLVCDGMGGARGGKVASAIAVNSILRSVFNEEGSVDIDSIRHAFEQTNRQIFNLSRNEKTLEGMGTTGVLLVLIGDRMIAAHVGDSRLYMLREGKLTRVTRDHTIVQDLIDSGAITPADAVKHPLAHMLTRSLGPSESVEVEIKELDGPIQPGDRFLLCCDGLYNHVSDPEIEQVLASDEPDRVAETLLQKALAGGGLDNITIEVVEPLTLSDSAETIDYPAGGKVRIVVSNADPTTEQPKSPTSTLSLSVESLQGFDPAKLPAAGEEMSQTGFFRADQVAELAARQRAEEAANNPHSRGDGYPLAEGQHQTYTHPSMDNLLRIKAEPVGIDETRQLNYDNDDEEDDLIGELNLLRIAAILVIVFAIVSVVVVFYRHDIPRVVSALSSMFTHESSSDSEVKTGRLTLPDAGDEEASQEARSQNDSKEIKLGRTDGSDLEQQARTAATPLAVPAPDEIVSPGAASASGSEQNTQYAQAFRSEPPPGSPAASDDSLSSAGSEPDSGKKKALKQAPRLS